MYFNQKKQSAAYFASNGKAGGGKPSPQMPATQVKVRYRVVGFKKSKGKMVDVDDIYDSKSLAKTCAFLINAQGGKVNIIELK